MLKRLSVSDFRNLNLVLELSPGINIIHGNNGSGKSSILEAIHYLSFGRSFRASNASQMIAHNKQAYTIQAIVCKQDLEHRLSVHRQETSTQAKINATHSSMVKLATLLPTLFIDCDSHRNYFTSSTHRRRMFDWLLFHVEHDYIASYKAYNKALKHRNAALKINTATTPWDKIMHEEAIKLHQMRKRTFALLLDKINQQTYNLLDAELTYNPGYDVNLGLLAELHKASTQDRKLGYTTVGPHKADWQLLIKGVNAVQIMSQGQQKIAHLKLVLLHYEVMKGYEKTPLVMIDDMPAELDKQHKALLENFLLSLESQVILTAIHPDDVNWVNTVNVFHVEQS